MRHGSGVFFWKAAAFGLVCKLLDGDCIGQLQQMCPSLTTQEQGQMIVQQGTGDEEPA